MRAIITTTIILSSALGASVATAGPAKPGLWQVAVTKNVVDGQDRSGQMAAATSRMDQALANMPPEQRARVQAMMQQHGAALGANGTVKICISPEQAARNEPVFHDQGHCSSSKVSHSGDRVSFEFSCTNKDTTTTGKGESTIGAERIASTFDSTTSGSGGSHTMHMESQLTYLGADCGTIKPAGSP